MAKKIQKYALCRDGYRREFRVLGVTTVKGRQAYGRWMNDEASTHVSERDVIHYFDSEAEAEAAQERIDAADEQHRPLVEKARADLNQAESNRRIAIKAAAVKKDHDL